MRSEEPRRADFVVRPMSCPGRTLKILLSHLAPGALAWAAPAMAQDTDEELFASPALEDVADNVLDGDYVIVGAGALSMPDYEGSNDRAVTPAAGLIGRVGGVGFRLRGPSLTTDFIDDPGGAEVTFRLGPTLRLRMNRSGKVDDEVVARLGKLDRVLDAGIGGGIAFRKLLTGQDSLSFGVGGRWAVSGEGGGYTVSAGTSYLLPVSRGQVVGLAASLEWVSGDYARYNYNVSPQQSLDSGLPAYTARGGLNEFSTGAFTAWDLNGNILDGGLSVGGGFLYSRLYGSAAEAPITRLRGSRNQWMFGGGIGYTF